MKKLISLITLSLLAIVALIAQDSLSTPETIFTPPPITGETDLNDLLNLYPLLYGAITTLLSYFSTLLPGVNKFQKVGTRVLTIGIITGVVFKVMGLAMGWQLVIAFIGATLVYDKALEPASQLGNGTKLQPVLNLLKTKK